MTVDGKGDVSACGSRGSEDILWVESDGGDLMVDVLESEVFFDGICGGEEFRDFERRIDQTLEIKDDEEEGVELYNGIDNESNGASSDEVVSCVRALVQALPLTGVISQQELMVENHEPIGSEYNGFRYPREYLKRKRDTKYVRPKESASCCKKVKDTISRIRPSVYKQFEDFLISSAKYTTTKTMVSQLQMLARNPRADYSFLSSLVGFFSDFRYKNLLKQTNEDKRTELTGRIPYSTDMEASLLYPGDDIKDSYWTDMVIQTGSEVIPGVDTTWDCHALNSSSSILNAESPRKCLRKKCFDYSHSPAAAKSGRYSPAELILTFDDLQDIPSESKLNNIFRRFGKLRETETVIYQDSCRARVVFKKSFDAEVAYNSAKIFNIIGPFVVNYELDFAPLLSYNAKPTVEGVEMRIPKFSQEDTYLPQIPFQDLEDNQVDDITLEKEHCDELDDVDIMT